MMLGPEATALRDIMPKNACPGVERTRRLGGEEADGSNSEAAERGGIGATSLTKTRRAIGGSGLKAQKQAPILKYNGSSYFRSEYPESAE